MYLGSMALNTILGLYYNISNLKKDFSKEMLINGLIRAAITLIGALGITALISLLPEVLAAFGITAEASLFEGISTVAMAGVLGSSILRYAKDAITKFYTILGNKNSLIEQDKEEVE